MKKFKFYIFLAANTPENLITDKLSNQLFKLRNSCKLPSQLWSTVTLLRSLMGLSSLKRESSKWSGQFGQWHRDRFHGVPEEREGEAKAETQPRSWWEQSSHAECIIFVCILLISSVWFLFFSYIHMLTLGWSYLSVGGRQNGYSATRALGRGAADYDSCSSFMSSELESTSCFDSEDDDATSRSDVLSGSSDFFGSLFEFGWRNASGMSWGRYFAESNVSVVYLIFSSKVSPLCCCKFTGHLLMSSCL